MVQTFFALRSFFNPAVAQRFSLVESAHFFESFVRSLWNSTLRPCMRIFNVAGLYSTNWFTFYFSTIIFIHMVELLNEQQLSDILKAASDPTRRSILTTLVQEGPTRVTDLAVHYEMSLNAVSKHIKVLESAGLVTRKTLGRVHLIEVNMDPVVEIDRWFENLRSNWDLRLEKLEQLLTEETKNV
jgi:DNA-binding transcriptional ArsR family regulator